LPSITSLLLEEPTLEEWWPHAPEVLEPQTEDLVEPKRRTGSLDRVQEPSICLSADHHITAFAIGDSLVLTLVDPKYTIRWKTCING